MLKKPNSTRDSYEFSHRIGIYMYKKSFTIGRELVLPAASDAPRNMLGETATTTSNDTVQGRTEDMVSDVKEMSIQHLHGSSVFPIRLDDTKDNTPRSQLMY